MTVYEKKVKRDIIDITLIVIFFIATASLCWIDLYLLKKYFPQDNDKEQIEQLERERDALKIQLVDCKTREELHL